MTRTTPAFESEVPTAVGVAGGPIGAGVAGAGIIAVA